MKKEINPVFIALLIVCNVIGIYILGLSKEEKTIKVIPQEQNPKEVYLISDTHFGDEGWKKKRPEKCLEELISSLSIIDNNDTLIHLGDVTTDTDIPEEYKDFLQDVKGYKILTYGNHYKPDMDYMAIGFDEVVETKKLSEYPNIVFSHIPQEVSEEVINVHGHLHNSPYRFGQHVSGTDELCK
jgi:calcineurin-like phosphoesterase family protein